VKLFILQTARAPGAELQAPLAIINPFSYYFIRVLYENETLNGAQTFFNTKGAVGIDS
jgi:hypothetical protein